MAAKAIGQGKVHGVSGCLTSVPVFQFVWQQLSGFFFCFIFLLRHHEFT